MPRAGTSFRATAISLEAHMRAIHTPDLFEDERAGNIYRTAARIIYEKGFDATSMNEIAEAVELTKPGLYYYVKGKKELLFAIMGFAMDLLDSEVVGPAQQMEDPEERLRIIVRQHARLLTREAGAVAILIDETGGLTEEQRVAITRRKRAYFDFLRETLEKLAAEEVDHLNRLEGRYRALLERDPELESRPTFLFFKGAANGLFAEGTEQLSKPGVDEAEALRIGIRCERGSHRFFKRYGEKFEDSEGKQVFLEFAEEERQHLELLIREYRALITRTHGGRKSARATAAAARTRSKPARKLRPAT